MTKNSSKSCRIEPYVIHCMIMKLPEKEALEYLNDPRLGFSIKARKYWEIRKQIRESRHERLAHIAKEGFVDQHLERLAQLELVNEEMWKQYKAGNFKGIEALGHIAEVQNLIAQFYDSSQQVMENSISMAEQEKPLST